MPCCRREGGSRRWRAVGRRRQAEDSLPRPLRGRCESTTQMDGTGSMLWMWASASACFLVVADVFRIVMGVVGWWWRLLNEAEAHGRHDFISAAKPASARDAPDRSA
jgi:hypothetical protein